MLLLPGFDGTGKLFSPLISALGEGVEVKVARYENEIVLDDYIETVASLLTENDGETVLVAESFSGPIALAILARYPTRVKTAVLSATFAVSPFRLGIRMAGLLPVMALRMDLMPDMLIRAMCLGQKPDHKLLSDVLTVIHSVPARTVSSRLKVLASMDLRSLLPQIDIPVLYLQAMQDRIVSARLSRQLVKNLENVSVRKINGPHLLLQSQSQDCASVILEHVWNNMGVTQQGLK